MKFWILLFFTSPVFSQSFDFQEQQKEFLKEVKKDVPSKVYEKIKKIEFRKVVLSDSSPTVIEDSRNISMKVQTAANDLICHYGNVATVEVEGMYQFQEALRSALIKNAKKNPCNPHAKEIVSLEGLNKIFKKLKNKSAYNNDHPNGVCFSRTYLISRDLDNLGVKSKQLYIEGWILASYQKGKYYGVEGYDHHKANIVSVSTDQGVVDYVIDPMFTDRPIPLDDYKSMVTTKTKNHYQILRQDHFGFVSDKTQDETTNDCFYNEYVLDEENEEVKARADLLYQKRHDALLKDKFLSREEALEQAKKRIEPWNLN